jgi:hypothetical protein
MAIRKASEGLPSTAKATPDTLERIPIEWNIA